MTTEDRRRLVGWSWSPGGLRGAVVPLRFSCYGCGGSQGWWVQWESPFDKGYQCSRCSSSAVITREGRVIGRKSQDWQQAVDAYLLAAEVEWPLDEILDGLIV